MFSNLSAESCPQYCFILKIPGALVISFFIPTIFYFLPDFFFISHDVRDFIFSHFTSLTKQPSFFFFFKFINLFIYF